jgi:hypothetical protein
MDRIPLERIRSFHVLMRGQGFVPCEERIAQVDMSKTKEWLKEVLLGRLKRKAAEVTILHDRSGGDVEGTMYRSLARSFGMQVNAEPFSMLADATPLSTMRRFRNDPIRMEALLFGQAGMLQVDLVDEHPRELQAEYAMLASLHQWRPMPVAAWKFGRMRPANFPTIRIAQFAQLLMRCDGSFLQMLRMDDVDELRSLLDVEAGPYWNTHHRFDHPCSSRVKRLGRAAADHIIINAIVPTLFALGRAQGRPAWEAKALALLDQLPAERNTVFDGWEDLGLNAATAAEGQALLELRRTYCRQRQCLSCVIGTELLRNSR